MQKLLEQSKYLILIGVFSSLFASVAAFFWGAAKTVLLIGSIAMSMGKDPSAAIALIELMDTFLIATALLVFSIGMYELSIAEIALPSWLVIHDLHDLKVKLGSIIILVMSITFLKHLIEWSDPQATLFFGIAITVVSGSLIAFIQFGGKE